MFKTEAFVSEKVWGYEKWIVSTHAVGQSTVSEDSNVEIADKKLSEIIKGEYPLLIKLIQANETLSVQVHPNDEYARRVENTYGKTECWYILDAIPGATLVCGLNKEYTKDELSKAINENKLGDCLRYVPVSKGDFVFIPAGTVHAIQGGLRLLEVQEPSDITYRLYDWGRPREIHVAKGLEVTKSSAPDPIRGFSGVFECGYFQLEKCDITKETCIEPINHVKKQSNGDFPPAYKSGWISLYIISGIAELISSTGEKCIVQAEDTIMLNVAEKITVIPQENSELSLMMIM